MRRRGPLIHGILLLGALGLGWQTWTRDKSVVVGATSKVTVWKLAAADIDKITIVKTTSTTVIERKPEGYLWGTTTGSLQVAPPVPPDMMDVSTPPPTPGDTSVHEYPIGDEGTKLLDHLATFKAKRDVGAVTEDWQKSDYGINDKSEKLTIDTKSGPRVLILGDNGYGSDDRYAFDDQNKHVYLVAGDVIHSVTYPDTLKERKIHGFDLPEAQRATISAGGKTRTVAQLPAKGMTTSWADGATPDKADQTLGNFMDQIEGLVPLEYVADPGGLQPVLAIDYQGKAGALGKFELFKRPASSGQDQFEYYVRTERTRVLGKVSPQVAGRAEQGVGALLGG